MLSNVKVSHGGVEIKYHRLGRSHPDQRVLS